MSRMRVALGTLRPGATAVVATLPDDPALADELAALRVFPGEEIEVVQTLPFEGPVIIRCAGGVYALGRGLADQLKVEW